MSYDNKMTMTRLHIVMQHISLECGIVPVHDLSGDVAAALSSIDPEEGRKMKRKYRKLWRKLAKGMSKSARACAKRGYGLDNLKRDPENPAAGGVPSMKQKSERKFDVYAELHRKASKILCDAEGIDESVQENDLF